MTIPISSNSEWLEASGLGSFASGTVSGRRTRRYHALLMAAASPPTERFVLVNGFEAWVEANSETYSLSTQYYAPDVIHPHGDEYLQDFESEPWPRWVFALPNGIRIELELFAPHESAAISLRWRLLDGSGPIVLRVRPLMSGRDYHSLHLENSDFRFGSDANGEMEIWRPYSGVPGVCSQSNGIYQHAPEWYRNFMYTEERSRGLDDTEDLASPGVLEWDLSKSEAVWLLSVVGVPGSPSHSNQSALEQFHEQRAVELARREAFETPLHRAADQYLVRRGTGKTIIAGYPWFTDWGRDTFIAIRGLCIATERLDDAERILTDWAGLVSEGMLPNVFPDQGHHPEYNSVDASLWYIIAVHDFLQGKQKAQQRLPKSVRQKLQEAVEAILTGYSSGTRFGIHADTDGLLAAGVPGVQLTWMDAKVGDWVVTPRIGKPVEIQALWFNAVRIGGTFSPKWNQLAELAQASFLKRFWNESGGTLYDNVDVDHQSGTVDSSFRPNQILAVGGLPESLITGDKARAVVEAVASRLWTPLGLRSLATGSDSYASHYRGGVVQRDGSYHQGTVWPWLIGPFVEAWLRVYGCEPSTKQTAYERFIQPILDHLSDTGLGHVSEIVDAELPHTPCGCPFQAWSLGELLRLQTQLFANAADKPQRQTRSELLTHA